MRYAATIKKRLAELDAEIAKLKDELSDAEYVRTAIACLLIPATIKPAPKPERKKRGPKAEAPPIATNPTLDGPTSRTFSATGRAPEPWPMP